MIDPTDLEHCREAIRHGSRSFHAASKLLPAKVRDPSLALYAFCRLADDAVDLGADKAGAVARLRARLDLAYRGTPRDAPADRAFAAVIEDVGMPRALPEALLEGLEWDASVRRYGDLSELRGYGARVAASVGAMMCVLMGVRDADALARACDLGVAMQLTNIARDVGEDAREGRLYLPLDWLEKEGIDPEAFLADPRPDRRIEMFVRRLLDHADELYARSEAGIAALPRSVRPGIFAARHIYAGIGVPLRRAGCDAISNRARTTGMQKGGWLALAGARTALTMAMPRSAILYARPLPEVAFLVDATARARRTEAPWGEGRAGALVGAFARLEETDRARIRAGI
ncbi:15-cis-phytoene synthase [Palleronia sp. LCG004]|uniref:15-cis-phytoene synthase n=1 Tax=Palleronia sp. LCG004 TaxID=3079304 RepID=UPI002942A0E1|nr:phytoene/squalene synthase family protein [Palleronia sp. LCG004]WOI56337.1 phytoene/squalene synthase family protein [Palleronia sp. LCG004]